MNLLSKFNKWVWWHARTLLTCLDECWRTRQAKAGAVLRHHSGRVLQATH